MNVTISLGKNFRALELGLRKAPEETIKALEAGLQEALGATANVVRMEIQSRGHTRSGALQRAITSYKDSRNKLTGYVGVGNNTNVGPYAWLLGDETKTITAKKGWFLSIPIMEGLTRGGTARFTGPRDPAIQAKYGRKGFFFTSKKGNTLFAVKRSFKLFGGNPLEASSIIVSGSGSQGKYKQRGKRKDKLDILFVLKHSVMVDGLDIFPHTVEGDKPRMKETIRNHLYAMFKKLNLR